MFFSVTELANDLVSGQHHLPQRGIGQDLRALFVTRSTRSMSDSPCCAAGCVHVRVQPLERVAAESLGLR